MLLSTFFCKSSFQYFFSVIPFATSDCLHNKTDKNLLLNCFLSTATAFLLGLLLSAFIFNIAPTEYFNQIALHVINLIMLIKHSIHCFNPNNKLKNTRRYNGIFGNQKYGSGRRWLMFVISIMDSVEFRVLLYTIFCLLPLF